MNVMHAVNVDKVIENREHEMKKTRRKNRGQCPSLAGSEHIHTYVYGCVCVIALPSFVLLFSMRSSVLFSRSYVRRSDLARSLPHCASVLVCVCVCV